MPGLGRGRAGDRVPDLGDSLVWSHADPAPSFEPGTEYVPDIRVAWCPPCYPIVDQLSALVREHSGDRLAIIGHSQGSLGLI